jgi:hypothetical protein
MALLPHCELIACTTWHLQGPPPTHGCTIPSAAHTRARVAPATIWSHGIILGFTKEKEGVGGEDALAERNIQRRSRARDLFHIQVHNNKLVDFHVNVFVA